MTLWPNTNCRVWRMEHVCVILLLLCSTILQAADDVDGVVGEDVVLPCSIKPTSDEDIQEVIWTTEKGQVHKYKNQQDDLTKQHSDYKGRTSLFKEELQSGNLSLKITSVRLSDMDKYTCLILGQSGPIDTQYVHLKVEAVGSTPVITPVSLNNGSVSLQCESTGWSAMPDMEWRDNIGQNLSAERSWLQSTAKITVRVEKSAGPIFFCRVWTQRQTREGNITVPDSLFVIPTFPVWGIICIVVAILFVGCLMILISWVRGWLCWNIINDVCLNLQGHKIPSRRPDTTTRNNQEQVTQGTSDGNELAQDQAERESLNR